MSFRRDLDPNYKAHRTGGMERRRQAAISKFWASEGGFPARWDCCPATPPVITFSVTTVQTWVIEVFIEF